MKENFDKDDSRYVQFVGRHFAWGILQVVACIIVISWILMFIENIFNIGTDDCDENGFHRCGANVVVDHLTGLQYLATSGGITPRLNKDGVQIGSNVVLRNNDR